MSNTPAARLAKLKQENPRWDITRASDSQPHSIGFIAVYRANRAKVIRASYLGELEARLLREKRLGGDE